MAMNLQERNAGRALAFEGREKGFTLIETAIALCILTIVALGMASLFVYAINYNSGASDRTLALAIAQQRMERLRRSSFTDTGLTAPTTTDTVSSAGRQYTVVTTICSTSDCGGSSALKIITIQVVPQGASSSWARAPATLISQRSIPSPGPYER